MRLICSGNRTVKILDPYRILALRVIETAFDDRDIKWFKGSAPLLLKIWCAKAEVDIEKLKNRAAVCCPVIKKQKIARSELHRQVREYQQEHPKMSPYAIGKVFKITSQRSKHIINV